MKQTATYCLFLFTILSTPLFASNYSFLQDSPIRYFTDTDWKSFNAAKSDALNHRKDREKLVWKNPETKSWGYFIPFNTIKQHGSVCRYLTMYEEAEGRTGMSTYKFCKSNNGPWKIVLEQALNDAGKKQKASEEALQISNHTN